MNGEIDYFGFCCIRVDPLLRLVQSGPYEVVNLLPPLFLLHHDSRFFGHRQACPPLHNVVIEVDRMLVAFLSAGRMNVGKLDNLLF